MAQRRATHALWPDHVSGLNQSEPPWFWAKENPPPVKEAGFGKGDSNLLFGCYHQAALCLPLSVICPGSDVLFLEDHSIADLGLS